MAFRSTPLPSAPRYDAETEARIAAADQALRDLAENYLSWVQADLALFHQHLEQARSELPAISGPAFLGLADIAHNLKGQAASFGFDLLTEAGARYCALAKSKPPAPVLLKSAEALSALMAQIVAARVQGTGGPLHLAMLEAVGPAVLTVP